VHSAFISLAAVSSVRWCVLRSGRWAKENLTSCTFARSPRASGDPAEVWGHSTTAPTEDKPPQRSPIGDPASPETFTTVPAEDKPPQRSPKGDPASPETFTTVPAEDKPPQRSPEGDPASPETFTTVPAEDKPPQRSPKGDPASPETVTTVPAEDKPPPGLPKGTLRLLNRRIARSSGQRLPSSRDSARLGIP
jgi:hypothetical protein